MKTRVCVSTCPSSSDLELTCRPNSKVPSCSSTTIYQSNVGFDRLGGFCTPMDSSAQSLLLRSANLQNNWNFLDIIDTVLISMLISFGIGVIWIILVQLIPRIMAAVAIYLAILTLIGLGILLLVDTSINVSQTLKIIVAILLIILSLLFASYLCFYRKRNSLIGIFLDWGTKCLRQRIVYVFYIIIFIIFTFGLFCLCLFQHIAFTSYQDPAPQ